MKLNQDAYDQLSYYTLSHTDPAFIHQHIVDAYTAQTADQNTKPIAITFALIGLYLYIEKKFTGKQVQQVHMRLANKHKLWPTFPLPKERGNITVVDVLNVKPGKERDEMIQQWSMSVWKAYTKSHQAVAELFTTYMH